MSKCSWWKGGHNFVIVAKGAKEEIWYNTFQGMKLAGSEFIRYNPTIIQRCTKCLELRAFDEYEAWPISIDLAKKKILNLGGIIGEEVP